MIRSLRLFGLLTFLAFRPLLAQIGVSPPMIEFPLGETPVTRSTDLINYGSRDVSVRVKVVHFDLDEKNEVRILPATPQSLDQWLVIQPGTFDLPAGKTQTVRFSVRPKVKPEPGEHRAMLFFEELPGEESITKTFRVLFRMGAAIYAQVGDVRRVGTIKTVEVLDGVGRFEIESSGTAHVRLEGAWGVWPARDFPGADKVPDFEIDAEGAWKNRPATATVGGRLVKTPVYPGTKRVIPQALPRDLAPGDYILLARGLLGEVPFVRTASFRIEKPAAIPPPKASGADPAQPPTGPAEPARPAAPAVPAPSKEPTPGS